MRLLLLKTISGDGPFFRTVAEARVYEPHEISVNQHGAVSVRAANERWLGVKPHEMRWLDKPSAGTEQQERKSSNCMKRKKISREDLLENLRQAELAEAIARREIENVVRGCIGQLKSGAGSLHRSLDSLAEVEAAIRVAGAALDSAREFGIPEWRQALNARERARRDWERAVR